MWRTQTKNQSTPKTVALFRSGTQTFNSRSSLGYAHHNKSIIYFNKPRRSLEKYTYVSKKHPLTCYPAAKHQNVANLELQTYEKNQWTFLWHSTIGVEFSARNDFTNLGSFAKSFCSCRNHNSLIIFATQVELSTIHNSTLSGCHNSNSGVKAVE